MAYALDNRGGGQALPPFLQGRVSTLGGGQFGSRPMITPKSTVAPGETKPKTSMFGNIASRLKLPPRAPGGGPWGPGGPQRVPTPTAPKITPAASAAVAPAPTGQPAPAQTLYEFFKNDLERQRDAAIANARTDASSRGVFYGTPLTTSQGDIQTEFGRGLGQLQAGILQNEQGNELQRLQLASSLLGQTPQASSGGISPDVFQTIGSLFAPRPGPTGAPPITPATQPKQPPLTKETLRR